MEILRSTQQPLQNTDDPSSTESPTVDSSLVVEESSEENCIPSVNEESSDEDSPITVKPRQKKQPLQQASNMQEKFLQMLDENPSPEGAKKASMAPKTSKRR